MHGSMFICMHMNIIVNIGNDNRVSINMSLYTYNALWLPYIYFLIRTILAAWVSNFSELRVRLAPLYIPYQTFYIKIVN